jgi:hypothetical protein
MDFLQKYTSSQNFSSQILQNTDGKAQKLLSTQEVKPMIKVVNCERVVIKPRHEIVVKAQIDGELNGEIIIEPRKKLMEKTGLLVARVVVCVQDQGDVPIKILNTTNKTITVYKGQTLGEVQELESIEDVKQKQVQGERENHISRDNAPVDEYIKKAIWSEGSAERSDAVVKLLTKYQQIVSRGPHDLGKTNVVKHNIETNNEAPVKSGVRRIAFDEREEANKEISQMVNGIIE